ncbi:MAG TPA: hypothetical protein VG328_15375 [Stellaceae bacterium]|jgi:hypothetical protein|nr:hypothetical protein [Stellaceae bacterium]
MDRVRIFACAGAGVALSALGWFAASAQATLPEVSVDALSRSTGVALLGFSMLAAGLVFRAAIQGEKKAPESRPQAREFRRGFGDCAVRAQAQLRQPTQRGVVVSLRRAVAEQGTEFVSPADTGTALPASEIERLQDLLRDRAAHLVACKTDMAKRSFMRSGVDLHGITPQ